MNSWQHSSGNVVALATRLLILLLPSLLLLAATLRDPVGGNLMLWMGTAFQVLVLLLSLLSRGGWRQPLGPSVITLYLIALAWLWFGDRNQDWYTSLAKSVLLVVPLIVFAFQTLHDSGAPAMRRANMLARRLSDR